MAEVQKLNFKRVGNNIGLQNIGLIRFISQHFIIELFVKSFQNSSDFPQNLNFRYLVFKVQQNLKGRVKLLVIRILEFGDKPFGVERGIKRELVHQQKAVVVFCFFY